MHCMDASQDLKSQNFETETETLYLQDRDETETFQKTSRDRLETETLKAETTSLGYTRSFRSAFFPTLPLIFIGGQKV